MRQDQFYRSPKIFNQFTQLDRNDAADQELKLKKAISSAKMRAINRLVHIEEDQSYFVNRSNCTKIAVDRENPQNYEIGSNQRGKERSTNLSNLLDSFFSQKSYSNFGQPQPSQRISYEKAQNMGASFYNQDPLRNSKKSEISLKSSQVSSRTQKNEPSFISELFYSKRSSQQKTNLSHQQVLSFSHVPSTDKPEEYRRFNTFGQNAKDNLDSRSSSTVNQANYSNYCASCDEFMTSSQHACTRKLYNLQQISKALQRISTMIEETKLTKYSNLAELIDKSNNLRELKVFFDFLKTTKNNLILRPEGWSQHEQIVLKRLINVCGKKISLVL